MPRRFCCGVIDIRSEAVLGASYSMCSGFKIMHQRSPLDQTLKIEVMSWTSWEQNRILEQKMPVHEDVCELFCLRKKTLITHFHDFRSKSCELRGESMQTSWRWNQKSLKQPAGRWKYPLMGEEKHLPTTNFSIPCQFPGMSPLFLLKTQGTNWLVFKPRTSCSFPKHQRLKLTKTLLK